MGITRDSRHKRSHTGAKRSFYRKKRKFEMGRPMASTKLGLKRIHIVRCRGGNVKKRAMRLDTGSYSWGSEGISRNCRILGVVYNASNNELVRTNTLVKGAIVQIDATPFRLWFEKTYGVQLGKKKGEETEGKDVPKLDPHFSDQFTQGRIYAQISSRPGQIGRADGYLLEGKELDFYLKKIKHKK